MAQTEKLIYSAVGRRKSSVARVYVSAGTGGSGGLEAWDPSTEYYTKN